MFPVFVPEMKSCVELKLFSKECVRLDDLEVGNHKIRGNLPTDGHRGASTNFLDPEFRVKLEMYFEGRFCPALKRRIAWNV